MLEFYFQKVSSSQYFRLKVKFCGSEEVWIFPPTDIYVIKLQASNTMSKIYKVLRIIISLILILFMLILIGDFFWGIPADITDRSAMEGWVEDASRISNETKISRVKTGLLFIVVLIIFVFVIKRKNK